MLNCDELILEYFRSKHPLQEIRTWCNITLGLFKFCREEAISGFPAILNLVTKLRQANVTKMSLHQREIYTALKLTVLAVRDNDYTYGIRYCHKLMSDRSQVLQSTSRVLRYYRLTSYLFEEIQELVSHGLINLRSITAIANELEVREPQRYKYKRKTQLDPNPMSDTDFLDSIINDSIDNLFASLESYASMMAEDAVQTGNMDTLTGGSAEAELRFDIGIQNQVEFMIKQLNLQPSGPHGIIDLGDDDIQENDDW